MDQIDHSGKSPVHYATLLPSSVVAACGSSSSRRSDAKPIMSTKLEIMSEICNDDDTDPEQPETKGLKSALHLAIEIGDFLAFQLLFRCSEKRHQLSSPGEMNQLRGNHFFSLLFSSLITASLLSYTLSLSYNRFSYRFYNHFNLLL